MKIPAGLRTWAEIDLSAIRHNMGVVRKKIGPGPGIVAIVKADAYGHGMNEVAHAVRDLAACYGVANLDEARRLEKLRRDVLLLGPALPAERREIVRRDFIATVSSAAEAGEFAGGRVNFKIDTGMGRVGCWQDEAERELQRLVRLGNVRVHGISTHLPVPDEDAAFTRAQLSRFGGLAKKLRVLAPGAKIHVLNSAGVLRFPGHAHDLVRPGLMLYGSAYPKNFQPLLRPALTWKTRVILVREVGPGLGVSYGRTFITKRPMRIAALAVGYADGFPRQASNRGAQVLIRGRRCPVLGRVTMDQILVDVTGLRGVKVEDEAVLLGRQGQEEIFARELADQAGTISWEIFTGIQGRVKKIHV